jgi:threonine dehydrogenase-like Zn-dependent dehydrogenase
MAELVDRLTVWGLHPEITVTRRFGLEDAAEAYRLVDEGRAGKVALIPDTAR